MAEIEKDRARQLADAVFSFTMACEDRQAFTTFWVWVPSLSMPSFITSPPFR